MNALTSELRDLRAQLEEATAVHAQKVKELQEQTGSLGRQREASMREVSYAAVLAATECCCVCRASVLCVLGRPWGSTCMRTDGGRLTQSREQSLSADVCKGGLGTHRVCQVHALLSPASLSYTVTEVSRSP